MVLQNALFLICANLNTNLSDIRLATTLLLFSKID